MSIEHICRFFIIELPDLSPENCSVNVYAQLNIYMNAFYIDITGVNECLKNLKSDLKCHEEWYKDLKKRRDPSAHRIPLYIPILKNDSSVPRKSILFPYFKEESESWDLWECLEKDLCHLIKIIRIVFKILKDEEE